MNVPEDDNEERRVMHKGGFSAVTLDQIHMFPYDDSISGFEKYGQ